jgi:hypothetical protein
MVKNALKFLSNSNSLNNFVKDQGYITYKDNPIRLSRTLESQFGSLLEIFPYLPKEFDFGPPKIYSNRKVATFMFANVNCKNIQFESLSPFLRFQKHINPKILSIIAKDLTNRKSLLVYLLNHFLSLLPVSYNPNCHVITFTFFRLYRDCNKMEAHQDNEEFFGLYMFNRSQYCIGGINTIYSQSTSKEENLIPLEKLLITKPLEYFIVDDRKILHSVSELTFEDKSEAYRDVLLISLCSKERQGFTALLNKDKINEIWK